MSEYSETLEKNARESLKPAIEGQLSPAEKITLYKQFLKVEEQHILERHRAGASGLDTANERSKLIDVIICSIFEASMRARKEGINQPIALVATGGYGRATLNPGSDIDLLFLLPRASTKLPTALQDLVQDVLYVLWDVGFSVGHACRSVTECIQQAKLNQENKTSLIDARLITGDQALWEKFEERFDKECLSKNQLAFFELRADDLRARHNKYSHTVFLQEPNIKESCGGLRDYQNAQWVARVKTGSGDLAKLVESKTITAATYRELQEAYDFLHRVRNELHYHTEKSTDQLTLFLQGIVATAFKYPQRNILRSTEAFMRDYYRHTRHIYQHTNSLMETFEIERDEKPEFGLPSFLTFRKRKREEFDGFIARDGRLFPAHNDIFRDDPYRLMRLFQHCQVRNLKLSPQIRRLIASHWNDIDRPFRYSKANREIFQAILERKGEAARILRLMHRIGFLGRYLPEFGALDCLVQHEFFHRYTADEHTLRCIDHLDALVTEHSPGVATFKRLFHEIRDPYGLYLALILHDTGRAENVREHIDGSSVLAARLCNRLQIRAARRRLIMFLVDNHLTFYRVATSRNLEDPEVIAEFASIMKTPENLDALLLFTYVDSNGTSPDSWNGWKQSLMLQLHAATHTFLKTGRENYNAKLDSDRLALRDTVREQMKEEYHPCINAHFDLMPAGAFHFKSPKLIVTQIRAVRHQLDEEKKAKPNAHAIKWLDRPERGYSEVVHVARDKPLLLEKFCCALASEQINILSADLFTREDGIVVNIFRVCTTNFEPVTSAATRKRFHQTFENILTADTYEPEKYLRRKINFLTKRTDQDIPVPVRASITNKDHPTYTTIQVQALDRIGLLHDLFHAINMHNLSTDHARICTEKGVAMDTLYITTHDGKQVEDPEIIKQLENEFSGLISQPETPE